MTPTYWRVLAQLSFGLFVFNTTSADAAQVISFYPTGSVKQVQQATVRFSEDMVAMGDPRAKSDPFAMTCNVITQKQPTHGQQAATPQETPKFTTRWADNRNWVLDFEKPLKAGMRCTFKLKTDAKDLSGAKVEGLDEYGFSTAGPALLGVAPIYGDIEPDQYFVALIDGAIDPKSVEAKAYFEVEGMPDKVGVKIIEGRDREAVITAAIKNNWRWNTYKNLLDQKPAKSFLQIKEMEGFVILAGNRRFPEEAKVVLQWPQGILSKTGLPVEEAQHFDFKVIEPFQAKFSCERSVPDRPCNPILDMRVNFTKRMPLKSLKGAKLVSTDGKTWIPAELNKGDQNKNIDGTLVTTPKTAVGVNLISNFEDEQVDSLTFKAPFPDSTKFKVILPEKLKDELGRALTNQKKYPLDVATDEYSPLIKFPASFGILELKADPVLPVSVRNIETQMAIQQVSIEGKTFNLSSQAQAAEVIAWYRRVLKKEDQYESRNSPILAEGQGSKFQMPKPFGEREFELVGIPLKKPGFYVVEMASPRLGEALIGAAPMYVATAALVTDMAVHFKKGRESSLVWVTQLSTTKPVSGAKVSILDVSGKELVKGTTNSDGILRLGEIDYPCFLNSGDDESESYSYSYDTCEVFAFAQKGDDVSFSSSSWSKGIESYRFNVSTEYLSRQWGPIVMHTVLDRMAAQPGEAIQMKHVVREHRETGFAMMNEKRLPKRVLIVHQGSKKTFTLPFEFDKSTGTAIGRFTIPKDTPLGRYAIYLSNKDQLPQKETEENDPFDWTAQETGHFIVSEYRLPLMKAAIKIQGEPLVRPSEVKADLSASYLSGGPAKGLKVKLRASLQPGYFVPDVPGGADYSFFATPVKTGVIDSESRQASEETFLKVHDLVFNSDGGLFATVAGLPPVTKIQRLALEMEYTDPNGEVKTTGSQVSLFPSEYVVGLRSDSWYAEPGKTKVMGVITNNAGTPRSDRAFTVEAFRTNYITHRKRLVGGFYSYDSKSEITALGKVCEGKSDELGRFKCEPKGLPAGSITLQAKTTDDKGRATYASVGVSVYEAGADSWWVPSDSDRIDLLPEKNRYEQAGSTIKPFVYATAFDWRLLRPESLLEDSPADVSVSQGRVYHPKNYDQVFRGLVSVGDALGSSMNLPAVRALQLVGEPRVLDRLRALGFEQLQEDEYYGPSLALGAIDVTLWQLTQGYRQFAVEGSAFSGHTRLSIFNILAAPEHRRFTFGMDSLLTLPFPAAVKTGTSKDMRDNWCIGWTPQFTVGVWVGNFNGEPMWNVSGMSGAAPIWRSLMLALHPNPKGHLTTYEPPSAPLPRRTISRIRYPAPDMLVGLDPDIPLPLQKLPIEIENPQRGHKLYLNDRLLSKAKEMTLWPLQRGKYRVELKSVSGESVDSVKFEVR